MVTVRSGMLITYIYIRKYVKERDIMTYERIVIPMDHGNRNMHLPWHRQCAVPLHPVKPDCLQ